jgi:hypothetical protein
MNTVQMSSAFLTKINIVPVDELKGEKVGVGVNGTIASTADTAGDDERKTADFTALESNKYECDQINFDFHIRYKQLDLWARFQDFQTPYPRRHYQASGARFHHGRFQRH